MKINRLNKNVKHILRRYMALSSVGFGSKDNEYYLISYPKSGNTWIRFLLANLLQQNDVEEISLKNLGQYVPDFYNETQRSLIFQKDSLFTRLECRFVKTHDPYFFFYRNRKVIYIVRDGRDAINSYYYYLNARRKEPITLLDIIHGRADDSAGAWSDHILGWTQGKCKQKIFVKYEDLLRDPQTELRKLLEFTKWHIPDEKIQRAVGASSFEKLREVENRQGWANPIEMDNERKSPFFRKGKAGDWSNTFSNADLEVFWEKHGGAMRALGYQ